MTAGDVKGDEMEIWELTAGSAIAKGGLVHIESDGYWDPCTTGSLGKFAVAIEAADGAASLFRAVVKGKVEVDCSGNVAKGARGIAGTLGTVASQLFTDESGNNVYAAGTFTEAGTDAGTATFFVGLI